MASLSNQQHQGSQDYLVLAEEIVSAQNARFTRNRRHIYKCLLKAESPLGAYDILGRLDGVGAQKPPTVYRALDWLIAMGLVQKIESISKYMVTPLTEQNTQTALLLCQTCGHAEPIDAGIAFESLNAATEAIGFARKQTVIEILGQCARHENCQAKTG